MVIDANVHPLLYRTIYDEETFAFWEREFGMGLMGPMDYDEVFAEMDVGGIDRNILLPLDVTSTSGGWFATNEQVAKIVSEHPDRFIGFASVDPNTADAPERLERAFRELGARGVSLHPAKQRFWATDECMEPIFELCQTYDRPIVFDAGLSWEPNAPTRYGHPLAIEEAIMRHPDVRVCLSHFAWPWVREMVMLMLKYPNCYTECSVLYLDSPEESIERLFTVDMGPRWFQRSFSHQVMFASNTPRFRAFKIRRAIEALDLPAFAHDALLGGNALEFLGDGYDPLAAPAASSPKEAR
jgi:predicted TIM-barrel fold metal-dependent hydrolase